MASPFVGDVTQSGPDPSRRSGPIRSDGGPSDGNGTHPAKSTHTSLSHDRSGATERKTHQRFVFSDPVALRYLEDDPSTTVLERGRRLEGYELYVVEQWACSRVHPTFVIATYTGDPAQSVLVGVLSVPTDQETWSPRLRVYYEAITQFHARPKETSLGWLMVTNLSGFPSALTVIPVPDGDPKKHREDFFVSENLKRLGCSGRAGISLSPPTGATQAKFHQLYRTSDRISFYGAVIELVKLCQVALTIFGKLGAEYADGLLCDVTERAINDWWTELGTDFYDLEPTDGILGPTTVAALMGMLHGARHRLHAYGAPVPKDPFDVEALKRGVAYFQKSQKLLRTRRLDRPTHGRLCKLTSKAASGDGWTMPKAVKTTMAELSGKGGEMVMGMVGARDKAGIGDIETVDIERFVQLASGERCKWLWYGKPRKSLGNDSFPSTPGEDGLVFGSDNHGGYAWVGRRRDSSELEAGTAAARRREEEIGAHEGASADGSTAYDSGGDRDQHLRKTVLKSVTGKMTDARSGFGRIKDAVGIPGKRGHQHKHSKDDFSPVEVDAHLAPCTYQNRSETALTLVRSAPQQPGAGTGKADAETVERTHPLQARTNELRRGGGLDMARSASARPTLHMVSSIGSSSSLPISRPMNGSQETEPEREGEEGQDSSGNVTPGGTMGKATGSERTADEDARTGTPAIEATQLWLRRSRSTSRLERPLLEARDDARWPRRMSFGEAEEAVLSWAPIGRERGETPAVEANVASALAEEDFLAGQAVRMRERMSELEQQLASWVRREMSAVDVWEAQASQDQDEINNIYYQRLEEYQALRAEAAALLAEERTHLTEAIRDVETLNAKIEYELSALLSKVEDVEDGLAGFDRQVRVVESKADQLEAAEKTSEGVLRWAWRVLVPSTMRRTVSA